jgi:tRNA pseudouridine55 synthase
MKGFSATNTRRRRCIRPSRSTACPSTKAARKGEEVEREPRFIRVTSFDLLRALPCRSFDFDLRCTKGTYVRTVAHDLGQKLGCGAHLSALRRTATDQFRIAQACRWMRSRN